MMEGDVINDSLVGGAGSSHHCKQYLTLAAVPDPIGLAMPHLNWGNWPGFEGCQMVLGFCNQQWVGSITYLQDSPRLGFSTLL